MKVLMNLGSFQFLWIFLLAVAVSPPSFANNSTTQRRAQRHQRQSVQPRSFDGITDPNTPPEPYVVETTRPLRVLRDPSRGNNSRNTACATISPGSRGVVLANDHRRNLSFVVFDGDDWARDCGRAVGLGQQPGGYVEDFNGSLRRPQDATIQSIRPSRLDPGDVQTEGQAEICQNCPRDQAGRPSSGSEVTDDIIPRVLLQRCGGGEDPSRVRECGFDALRERARSTRQCMAELARIECETSPWRDLDLRQRLDVMLQVSAPIAQSYGVDPRAFPCISARETGTLEPMTLIRSTCSSGDTARGSPQVIRDTFERIYGSDDLYLGLVHPFNLPQYRSNPRLAFDALALNVEFQMEVKAAVLATKFQDRRRANYREAFRNYNGHILHRDSYASTVNACLVCMRAIYDESGRPRQTPIRNGRGAADPISCLNHAKRDIRQAFDLYRASCPVRASGDT